MEAKFVKGLFLKFSFTLGLLFLGEQELIEPKRVDRLHLLFKDLRDWIALALKQVDKVHDFLLPQLKISYLILQWLQQALQVDILPNKHVKVFN